MSPKGTSRSKPPDPKQSWWLGPAVVYLCMFAVMLLVGLVATLFVPEGTRDPRVDVFSHMVTYSIALSVVYLHVRRFEGRKKFWNSVGIKREGLTKSLIWTFALYVIFVAVITVYWAFVGPGPSQQLTGFFEGLPTWYYGYLLIAFFVPVALTEELVFRGFMMDRFLAKGAAFAILASSLLFTSLHIWYFGFGIHALPLLSGLFILSVYWAIVYWKTRNIIGLIVFHGLYNATTAVGFLLPGAGVDAAMGSAIFIFGMVCLGYLFIMYLIRLFTEIEQLVKGKGKV